MSASEWATAADPVVMLVLLRDRGPVSERKLRLFAVACSRRQPDPFREWCWERQAVEAAEQFCDGATGRETLEAARAEIESRFELYYPGEPVANAGFWACHQDILLGAENSSHYAASAVGRSNLDFSSPNYDDEFEAARQVELRGQSEVLRDIFGNPFRPIPFDPAWRTEAVVSLAQGIYQDKVWGRMPVLADALEDAGCDSPEVLEHSRGPNNHVRGYRVVDHVLGRA